MEKLGFRLRQWAPIIEQIPSGPTMDWEVGAHKGTTEETAPALAEFKIYRVGGNIYH